MVTQQELKNLKEGTPILFGKEKLYYISYEKIESMLFVKVKNESKIFEIFGKKVKNIKIPKITKRDGYVDYKF